MTALYIYFGQFSAHDVTLTPTDEDLDCSDCATKNPMSFNFIVGDTDSFMNFRVEFRNQFDGKTHFLDSSNVYGSNEEENSSATQQT